MYYDLLMSDDAAKEFRRRRQELYIKELQKKWHYLRNLSLEEKAILRKRTRQETIAKKTLCYVFIACISALMIFCMYLEGKKMENIKVPKGRFSVIKDH